MNWAKQYRLRRERKVELASDNLPSKEQDAGRQHFDAPDILRSTIPCKFIRKLLLNPVTTVSLRIAALVLVILVEIAVNKNAKTDIDDKYLFW